jgi:putative tricarboxylic transport membrane protein
MIFTILPLARYMSRIVLIETTYLVPVIILVTVVAAFSERQYVFDMGVAIVFGIIGYVAHKTQFHVAAILIGVVLGPIFEKYLVRALPFLALSLLWPVLRAWLRRRRGKAEPR